MDEGRHRPQNLRHTVGEKKGDVPDGVWPPWHGGAMG
jgi:hypothetical protein